MPADLCANSLTPYTIYFAPDNQDWQKMCAFLGFVTLSQLTTYTIILSQTSVCFLDLYEYIIAFIFSSSTFHFLMSLAMLHTGNVL